MYWLCFYVEVNKTTMTFLLFLFGIFLALGMFLLTADLLRLPRLATQRAMLSVGRQEKKQARSVEALLMGWAIKPAVAASGTVAMGYSAIGYYEGNVALASPKEALDDLFDVLADLADNGTTAVENIVDGVTMLRMRVKSPAANN